MSIEDKIVSNDQAVAFAEEARKEGKKVVFTNGCFDILHRGHIDYLEKAAQLGDVMVLGLNSDQSVQVNKGSKRPIIDEQSRSYALAAMQFIDRVVLFDEETPEKLIRAIQPDILVKGGDYTKENIVGADFVEQTGGRVETIPFVEGYSTSDIIEKIKKI